MVESPSVVLVGDDEGLERFVNHITDTDHEWGPFLFLRPERDETDDVRSRGGARRALRSPRRRLRERGRADHGRARGVASPLLFPLATTLGFFAIYRFTVRGVLESSAERIARGDWE